MWDFFGWVERKLGIPLKSLSGKESEQSVKDSSGRL